MENYFGKVREYLNESDYETVYSDEIDEIFVITNEEEGIQNLVIGCADPILIIEQFLVEIKNPTPEIYKSLLQKNREIVHGGFVLDDTGKKVIFRDTLQIENLDANELEASINSLSLLISEYMDELISFTK